MSQLDITKNRKQRKWDSRELCGRAAWSIVYPLFRFSPRIFWSWRRLLLRTFGAQVSGEVHIAPTVAISIPWNLKVGFQAAIGDRAVIYNLGLVVVGDSATISQGAHVCAGSHDHRKRDMPLLKVPINIEQGAWICADAFVGPGVTIGEYAVVGARAVAMRDVEPWTIVVGNPAKPIGKRVFLSEP